MADMGNIHKCIPILNRVYFKGFPETTTEEEAELVFEQYGKIIDVNIIRDKITGESKGYGFITFDSQQCATKVIEEIKTVDMGGQEVTVGPAKIRRQPPRTFYLPNTQSSGYMAKSPRYVYHTHVTQDGLHHYTYPTVTTLPLCFPESTPLGVGEGYAAIGPPFHQSTSPNEDPSIVAIAKSVSQVNPFLESNQYDVNESSSPIKRGSPVRVPSPEYRGPTFTTTTDMNRKSQMPFNTYLSGEQPQPVVSNHFMSHVSGSYETSVEIKNCIPTTTSIHHPIGQNCHVTESYESHPTTSDMTFLNTNMAKLMFHPQIVPANNYIPVAYAPVLAPEMSNVSNVEQSNYINAQDTRKMSHTSTPTSIASRNAPKVVNSNLKNVTGDPPLNCGGYKGSPYLVHKFMPSGPSKVKRWQVVAH